ncbi:MAG: BlaB/IND/MUS family subclass B1 metallo-beta-lactamase [Chitinophagaceae bacterium]
MKRFFQVFLFAISSCLGTCSFAQVGPPKLEISHLSGDFYVFTTYNVYKGGRTPANGMYLLTDSGAVMFDSPWDTTQFQPLLDSIQAKHHKDVVVCIATHSHADKTAGLDFLKERGVKTFTTTKTDAISKEKGEKRAEYLMTKDTLFSVGQYQFETYYGGGGHTVDNIVIWFAKQKILYGGCLVKSVDSEDLGYTGEADLAAYPVTLKRIQARFPHPKFIIVGHGSWASTKSIDHTLQLLKAHR